MTYAPNAPLPQHGSQIQMQIPSSMCVGLKVKLNHIIFIIIKNIARSCKNQYFLIGINLISFNAIYLAVAKLFRTSVG